MRLGISVAMALVLLGGCGSHDAKEVSFSGGPADGHDYQWYKSHAPEAKAEWDFCTKQVLASFTAQLNARGIKTQGMSEQELVSNLTPDITDEVRKKLPAYCGYAKSAVDNNNFFKPAQGHY
ncbi:MAG: hypothetical protein HOP20_00015 [Sulfuriferula sp.]|nr:hypothetical protein [Sulfuriferula sp.]